MSRVRVTVTVSIGVRVTLIVFIIVRDTEISKLSRVQVAVIEVIGVRFTLTGIACCVRIARSRMCSIKVGAKMAVCEIDRARSLTRSAAPCETTRLMGVRIAEDWLTVRDAVRPTAALCAIVRLSVATTIIAAS